MAVRKKTPTIEEGMKRKLMKEAMRDNDDPGVRHDGRNLRPQ